MLERVKYDVQEAMRDQIENYLLQNVQMDLPTKLSDRQAERVAQRRALDMMMRGVPRHQVEVDMEQLKGGAKDQAARDLKLFFILQKVASEQNVDVSEGELNGRIALIAAQAGQRPEKVKQEMSGDGSLLNMYVQMREQKAVDKILEGAKIEDVEPEPKDSTEAKSEKKKD
jgi:trigger factor